MAPVGPSAGPARLRWATPIEAARVICQCRTLPFVWRIAVVVGLVLTAVNQGGALAGGHPEPVTWARVAANFVIPYTVSSLGPLRAYRVGPPAITEEDV